MRISENCVKCLYSGQESRSDDTDYLTRVRSMLDARKENDTAPYMLYQFNKLYESFYGKPMSFHEEKQKSNEFVLKIQDELRSAIHNANDPIAAALVMSRIGNYIDYAAVENVNEETLLSLFRDIEMRDDEKAVYKAFLDDCGSARHFLLIADNCGEIVLDKLLLELLQERFPEMKLSVLVRGGEVLNDVTFEDAKYAGIEEVADIVSNGEPIPGTVYEMLPTEAARAFDEADVILSKGQGNYESLSGTDRIIYYLFLCKCEHFVQKFSVPKFTGLFLREN